MIPYGARVFSSVRCKSRWFTDHQGALPARWLKDLIAAENYGQDDLFRSEQERAIKETIVRRQRLQQQ